MQNNSAAGGYIIRDWHGQIIRVGITYYGKASIIMGEARALRDHVKEALASGYTKITIEGDNLVIINTVRGTTSSTWQITNDIEEMRFWLS